jgi:hypothetical protein
VGLSIQFGIEDHLDDPLPVPQLNENESTQVSSSLDPSQKGHLSIHILSSQITTVICSLEIFQKIDSYSRFIRHECKPMVWVIGSYKLQTRITLMFFHKNKLMLTEFPWLVKELQGIPDSTDFDLITQISSL